MEFNNDFRYDLQIGKEGESLVHKILSGKKLEVKRDSWTGRTGNLAIEFESRGKPSGIATTEADYWVFVLSGQYEDKVIIIIETTRLKNVARKYYMDGRTKKMGDSNTSIAVLIPLVEISNFIVDD